MATLLADAKPAVICWNGSRGGSFGFAADRDLCAAITERTGVPSTTATLAADTGLRLLGCRRIGLVTPYRPAYIAKLMRVLVRRRDGSRCAGGCRPPKRRAGRPPDRTTAL